MVSPHVEYSSIVWSPFTVDNPGSGILVNSVIFIFLFFLQIGGFLKKEMLVACAEHVIVYVGGGCCFFFVFFFGGGVPSSPTSSTCTGL